MPNVSARVNWCAVLEGRVSVFMEGAAHARWRQRCEGSTLDGNGDLLVMIFLFVLENTRSVFSISHSKGYQFAMIFVSFHITIIQYVSEIL